MSLKVSNLSIVKSGKSLLENINFEANKQELIGIIGENGAGKSTLLHCLSGLEPSNQQVSINNRWIEDYPATELSQIRAALPQSNELGFPFEAKEVIRLGLSLSSLSLKQQESIIDKCLSEVDAHSFSHKNYLYLSGGEKQRIQLARVLAQLYSSSSQQKYLLLDEPTSALDLKHQFSILKLLKKMTKNNIGIFIIIHDLNLASLFCDKILLLKNGKLVSFDKPEKIIKQPMISKTFETDVLIMQHPQTDSPMMVNKFE